MNATKGKKRTYWQLEYWQTFSNPGWDTMESWHFHEKEQALRSLYLKSKSEPQFQWRVVKHETEVIEEHLPEALQKGRQG